MSQEDWPLERPQAAWRAPVALAAPAVGSHGLGVAETAGAAAAVVAILSPLPLAPPLPAVCASTKVMVGTANTSGLCGMRRASMRNRTACAAIEIASDLVRLSLIRPIMTYFPCKGDSSA